MSNVLSIILILLAAASSSFAAADNSRLDQFLHGFREETRLNAPKKTPSDVLSYFDLVTRKDWENAAHFYGYVRNLVPEHLADAARSAYLVSLYQLGLPHAFLNEWLESLNNRHYRHSSAERRVENLIAPDFYKWIIENAPELTPSQLKQVRRYSLGAQTTVFLNLEAWSNLRSPEEARALLPRLGDTHPFRGHLTKAAVAGLAAHGQAEAALQLLDQQTPSLKKVKPAYYIPLTRARLFYQLGRYAAAADVYATFLSSPSLPISIREEALWTWLRKGDSARLRGELVSLKSVGATQTKEISWDVLLLSTLSDLKYCYFTEVEAQLKRFDSEKALRLATLNGEMASLSTKPHGSDLFTQIQERRTEKLRQELAKVTELETTSVEGPAPLFGIQRHWSELRNQIAFLVNKSEQDLRREYLRRWQYKKRELEATDRRFRFVRAELQNQKRIYASAIPSDEAALESLQTLESRKRQNVLNSGLKSQHSFPVDSVMWADEIFKIQSVAQNRCVPLSGAKP